MLRGLPSLSRSDWEHLIDEWILSERYRGILKRKILDDWSHERIAEREGLTVRQLAQRLGGYGGAAIVGTARTIADEMQEWLEARACDGFNVMFPFVPAGLDEFVDQVVPELQRRGIFRTDYEGATLREHLGLPRPENRFFSAASQAAE